MDVNTGKFVGHRNLDDTILVPAHSTARRGSELVRTRGGKASHPRMVSTAVSGSAFSGMSPWSTTTSDPLSRTRSAETLLTNDLSGAPPAVIESTSIVRGGSSDAASPATWVQTPSSQNEKLLPTNRMDAASAAVGSSVALAAVAGFGLAQFFHIGPVRWLCAIARSIHELFWALIFLQMLGLSPLTGVLAIAIPYAGIMAVGYAFLFDLIPKERTAEFVGIGLLSMSSGQICGPLIGGRVIDTLGYRWMFPCAALFLLLGLLAALRLGRPRKHEGRPRIHEGRPR